MKVFIALILMMVIHTNVTYACYSKAEAEAEQGLRIHSELLVIGLTCVKMHGGFSSYNKYERFTVNNADKIADYEAVLIEYFKSEGSETPVADLHNLRSFLANDISKHAVKMGVQTFCDMFSSRLDEVIRMSSGQYTRWAKFALTKNPSTEPRCTEY